MSSLCSMCYDVIDQVADVSQGCFSGSHRRDRSVNHEPRLLPTTVQTDRSDPACVSERFIPHM